ncbi:MAG: transketolase C-terminal subunit, partial [Firmicutes bacterium]|nr:transketolase C-terminal subunit [Bacillota bacterium]
GSMSGRAVAAADALLARGIDVAVLHMPTIKPLDEQAVIAAASRCRLVVAAEEHNRLGGLGSAVAECLAEHLPTRICRIGIADRIGESGADDQLLAAFGLDAQGIERQVLAAIDRFQ